MAVLPADHRELFLPLIDGIDQTPPWPVFLRNLAARTLADRAAMIVSLAHPDPGASVAQAAAPRAHARDPIDLHRLEQIGLRPVGALRPGRIYALGEMLTHDDRLQQARQRAALADMGIGHGRWLRVTAARTGSDTAQACLVLVREQADFTGAAVAVLDTVSAHLAAALRMLTVLADQRLQTALANSALARLGVGQIAFDRDGRVLAADALAEAALTFVPDPAARPARRLNIRPDVARRLDQACAVLTGDPHAAPCVIRIDETRDITLLLRRSGLILPQPGLHPAVIGTLRTHLREPARQAIDTLAALHGLSANEAALAHALSLGETLIEAGNRLHLTPQTARNYSKRIYAKTATRGQADLVRLILTGVTPFAC